MLQYEGYYHYVRGDRLASFRIPGRAEAMGAPGQTPTKTDTPVAVRGGDGAGPAGSARHGRRRHRGGRALSHLRPHDPRCHRTRAGTRGVSRPERLGWPSTACARSVAADRCRHPADDERRGRARRRSAAASSSTGSAVCGVAPSTSARCRVPGRRLRNHCGRIRSVDVPFGIHPGIERARALRRAARPLRRLLHAAPRRATSSPSSCSCSTTFIAYGILERHPRPGLCSSRPAPCGRCRTCTASTSTSSSSDSTAAVPTMELSDYFRRQCFVSVEEVEPGLANDGRGVPRFGGVRVRLPARRRHLPRFHRRAARDRSSARPMCAVSDATTCGASTDSLYERHESLRRDQRTACDPCRRGPTDARRRARADPHRHHARRAAPGIPSRGSSCSSPIAR